MFSHDVQRAVSTGLAYLSISLDTMKQHLYDHETQTPQGKFTRRVEVLFQDFGIPLTTLKIEKFKERAI